MSEKSAVALTTTKVVGYFNPHKHSICIEISEINLKVELASNVFIKDATGRLINDPIFERYCHPKGLARSFAERPVPILRVPRFAKRESTPSSVRQATGFVRQGGRTVPTFAPAQQSGPREVAVNKTPHVGMSMEQARKLGLVGKPRLIPEDYGAEESQLGAPKSTAELPDIRYSTESRPRNPAVKAAATILRPDLTQAGSELPPEEAARRTHLTERLASAASTPTGDDFDPSKVKARPVAPVDAISAPPAAVAPKNKTPGTRPARRIAAPVQEVVESPVAPEPEAKAPVPSAEVAEIAESEEILAEEANPEEVPTGGGVIGPLHEEEGEMPPPNLEGQPGEVDPPEETAPEGQNFVCAADGKTFKFRSLLLRHVLRKFPKMKDELMSPYPPE